MSKLGITDIKQALWDDRFRNLFPEYEKEIREFISNPGCTCNVRLYRLILSHKDRLQRYFPTKTIEVPDEELEKLARNHWMVISCHIDELQKKMKGLPKGRKQIAVARWEDQVTVVINELEVLF